jgi:hypothetical protein
LRELKRFKNLESLGRCSAPSPIRVCCLTVMGNSLEVHLGVLSFTFIVLMDPHSAIIIEHQSNFI